MKPYNINPLPRRIPKDERVKYFSENIPHHNALCCGFMDEKHGIIALIGKEECYFNEMFERYEQQKKRFEN